MNRGTARGAAPRRSGRWLARTVTGVALLAAWVPCAAGAQRIAVECTVTEVWSPLVLPEADYLRLRRPTVRVEDDGATATVTRCEQPPGQAQPRCERIEIDWIARSDLAGSRKYYRFETRYDLQLFPDRTFVENDGRGTVYHGRCRTGPA